MPPQPQQGAPAPNPEPAPVHANGLNPWLLTGMAVIVAASGLLYWSGIFSGPENDLHSPKKIGILSFRQFNDVAAGFKNEMRALGYADAEYMERLAIPGPTMLPDIEAHVREMVAGNVDAIWASLEMQAKIAGDGTKELGRTDIPIVFMTRWTTRLSTRSNPRVTIRPAS